MSETGLRAAFLRRKSVDDIEQVEGGGLAKSLGLWHLTAIGDRRDHRRGDLLPGRSRRQRDGRPAV